MVNPRVVAWSDHAGGLAAWKAALPDWVGSPAFCRLGGHRRSKPSIIHHDQPCSRWNLTHYRKLSGKMRLTPDQIAVIRRAAEETFGEGSQVWLFGSRVDDRRRGGDIDLLVRPAQAGGTPDLRRKIRFLGKLERFLGERKIDVLIEAVGDHRPIVWLAHETGVRL